MDQRNFLFMAWGLATAWAIIAVYVITIALRESRLKKELDRVQRMIEDREKKL